MSWADYDLRHSTVCPVLLGQMGIWQNLLVKMVVHQNQPNPGD